MKTFELKTILSQYYSEYSVKSILNGRRRPSYQNILMLQKKHGVPFEAWLDIKSYVDDNKDKGDKKRLQGREKEIKEVAHG